MQSRSFARVHTFPSFFSKHVTLCVCIRIYIYIYIYMHKRLSSGVFAIQHKPPLKRSLFYASISPPNRSAYTLSTTGHAAHGGGGLEPRRAPTVFIISSCCDCFGPSSIHAIHESTGWHNFNTESRAAKNRVEHKSFFKKNLFSPKFMCEMLAISFDLDLSRTHV